MWIYCNSNLYTFVCGGVDGLWKDLESDGAVRHSAEVAVERGVPARKAPRCAASPFNSQRPHECTRTRPTRQVPATRPGTRKKSSKTRAVQARQERRRLRISVQCGNGQPAAAASQPANLPSTPLSRFQCSPRLLGEWPR
jgi:hypothetical protein